MSKIITPKFRVSYPHLFEARKAPGSDKAKYSVTALFTDDPECPPGSDTIADMKKLAVELALDKFGNTGDTKKKIKSGKIKMPFLDPEDGDYPEETALVMRFSTDEKYKPGVVDRFKGPDGKPRVITDADDVYPGCYARASVRGFAYDVSGNKGVSFALNNLQKLGEGDRIDSRTSATNEFDAMEDGSEVEAGDLAESLLED